MSDADITLPHHFTPREYQLGMLAHFDAGGLRYSGVWHRRAGKDRTSLAVLSKMAFTPGRVGTYWHCLPTLRQARKVVWDNITRDGERLMQAVFPDAIVAKRNEVEMKIELTCGSIVQLVGIDNIANNLGANPLHITFSEWALTDPIAWHLCRPILLENQGTAAFIFTPRGYNHAFDTHQVALRGEHGWFGETLTIDDTGIITRAQYDNEIAEGMPEELARQEYYCDFSAANVGSVLGRYVEQAERAGRITDQVAYDPRGAPVEVSGDIGFRDAAAWWFWQPLPGGDFALVDYDEDRGLDADDWIVRLQQRCDARGYALGRLWLPHDARVKTFQSKRSAVEAFLLAFGSEHVAITPQTKVADRVNAGRAILRRAYIAKSACSRGLAMLRDWHYEWDEKTKIMSREPFHDYASHGGDAFTYGAVALAEPAPVEIEPGRAQYSQPAHQAFTLDRLFEDRENAREP